MPTVKQKQSAKRASLAKKTYAKKTQERAQELVDIHSAYLALKSNPVLLDILAKANQFILWHNKLAQDGTGSRKTGRKDASGNDEMKLIYLTNDQRAGHLDRSSGIQELLDYIERQMEPVSEVLAKKASGR